MINLILPFPSEFLVKSINFERTAAAARLTIAHSSPQIEDEKTFRSSVRKLLESFA